MANKLYVGNLPFDTTNEVMQQAFSQAGSVVESVVMMDKLTGRPRGFGFVTMSTQEEATKAIELFNGKSFPDQNGRVIVVNEARPREDRPRGGAGMGSMGGGFGSGY